VTQIFHNGQPSHCGDRKIFEVMTSTLPKRTLGLVASLLVATLYQGNPDMKHKLWNITHTKTNWVLLVEQELPTLPELLSSPRVFSGVRVTRTLVLCVCFVDRCLAFCPFSINIKHQERKEIVICVCE
jgi:hypothetical protein